MAGGADAVPRIKPEHAAEPCPHGHHPVRVSLPGEDGVVDCLWVRRVLPGPGRPGDGARGLEAVDAGSVVLLGGGSLQVGRVLGHKPS